MAVGVAEPARAAAVVSLQSVVPVPASVQPAAGVTYTLPPNAAIQTHAGATAVGDHLAGILRPSTGYALPVTTVSGTPSGGIALLLTGADPSVGAEGYQLDITAAAITIRAQTAAGLFYGVQTLRQLLPPTVEARSVQPGPWEVAGGRIVDRPRYGYRGAMLDVSRHFFGPDVVKRYVDEISQYKVNVLHLHLSDDQGWRIVIDAWPRLATYGGSTQVGGGPGGYYTKAQYTDLVAYAAARHITIVPEIDMPGHTNAALASYAELNCDGVAPPLYTGIEVGFSSLCVPKEITYTFVRQVLAELAALTPGPYVHVGGDEAHSTSDADYRTFMNRIQPFVGAAGKTVMGWHQLGQADHTPGRVAQFWGTTTADADLAAAVSKGDKVVMSPANKAYLDMKYTPETPLGLSWAGLIEVQTAYNWDPATLVPGVPAGAILGVEAPMWSETLTRLADIEFMAFPRLPALAEIAWSPQSARNWDTFRVRLGAQGPRWTAQGINFYRSPQVPWASAPPTPGRVEAESFTSQSGVQIVADPAAHGGNRVGYIDNGDWIGFSGVSVTGRTGFTARVASGGPGGTIQVRAGSATGPLLGSVSVPNTGGYGSYVDVSTVLSAGSGPLHLAFTGSGGGLFDIDDFALTGSSPPATNLALRKPATADSQCAPTEGPEKAVNGSTGGGNADKWCSVGATKWWRVDLRSSTSVGRVVIRHAGAGGESTAFNTRDFDIQASVDGVTWSTVAQVRGNTANVTTTTFTPIAARHLRLNVLTPTSNSDRAARIYEFEAYAS
ncbi:family 20 glycosylhydrolase [Asanoa sp. WMMD1127]|uniref:family 20 glycosylhydrolase n=1 Tax=Asanoa sp. WMMD1127 TaxID=3016107 RepID=UPI00241685D8|nr:family 20 glycosylhydrolase [Asanoa sp. WMMD1127]MDG4825396.1 family 20 glycosylhydrolase [Asanoa sp. WMMD1127]